MSLKAERIGAFAAHSYPSFKGEKTEKTKTEQKPSVDKFEKSTKKDEERFSCAEAGKNFARGVFMPVTALIKHPFATIGILGATAATCAIFPVAGPVLGVGFAGLSVFQAGKGIFGAISNYNRGNYKKAEESFIQIGEGTSGAALTALGAKQSNQALLEALQMSKTGKLAVTAGEVEKISKMSGFSQTLKVHKKLFSQEGIDAIRHQMRPDFIKKRYVEVKNFILRKPEDKKPTISFDDEINFAATKEGQRRAALSDEDILKESRQIADRIFDEYGIPKKVRAKIELNADLDITSGGYFNESENIICVNPNAYRSGTFDIFPVLAHETKHAQQAYLRAKLPEEEFITIVRNTLKDIIVEGEPFEITYRTNLFTNANEMTEPPVMPQKMREDFAVLVDNHLFKGKIVDKEHGLELYKRTLREGGEEIPRGLKKYDKALDKLLAKYPEFVEQSSSEEMAKWMLLEYSQAQLHRFNERIAQFINSLASDRIPDVSKAIQKWKRENPVTQSERKEIMESLKGIISTNEGNNALGWKPNDLNSDTKFQQYSFSSEEVLAETTAKKLWIKELEAKLENLPAGETAEREMYLSQIENAKRKIKYLEKGKEYMDAYIKYKGNTEDPALYERYKKLQKEVTEASPEYAEYQKILKSTEAGAKYAFPYNVSTILPESKPKQTA